MLKKSKVQTDSKSINASELFIEALTNEGVENIYGVPGEENLDFLEALRKSNIKLILTRHEQGAGFMAATYGRLTGKTGVCIATLGPGATNLVTPAAYAQLGGFPLLMITGQKPIKHSKQGQFQIIDVVSLMQPLTKYTKQIVNVNMLPSMVRESFRLAEQKRPGATHLELPEDIAAEKVDSDTAPIFKKIITRRPIADDFIVKEAAKMIKAAKYPLLLIGAGGNRKQMHQALSDFVCETGIYFFNTQMCKGCVDERLEQFIGTAALSTNDYIHCAIERADLIINIGHDVVEKPPFFMEHNGKKIIHVNYFPAKVDNIYFPQLELIGDICSSVKRLTKEVGKLEQDCAYFGRVKQQLYARIDMQSDNEDFPMKPQRLVKDIRKAMPSNGIIALDNGIYKVWFARNYLAYEPNTILLDNALATMGAGLSSAMEAARIYPDRNVMAICGDGGFMMNSQEIETAVRMKLNLIVLVLNDSAYGMIRWKQYGMGLEDFGLEFDNPNFVEYANSFNAKGHRVQDTKSFVPLITECFAEGGVHIIDLPVDYSENNTVLIDELKQKVCVL